MKKEIIVITEDQMRFIYDALNKQYTVAITMHLYEEYCSQLDAYTSIELCVINNPIDNFRRFKLQYNSDDENFTMIFDYGYTSETFEQLVDKVTEIVEMDDFKQRIHTANTGGFFYEDKNIVIKTYKSA